LPVECYNNVQHFSESVTAVRLKIVFHALFAILFQLFFNVGVYCNKPVDDDADAALRCQSISSAGTLRYF